MVLLPEWDLEFVERSKRYTRRINAYRAGRALVLLTLPAGFAAASSSFSGLCTQPLLEIGVFFLVLIALFVLETTARGLVRKQKRRRVSTLLCTVPELVLLGVLAVYWWLLSPGHILLAIGAWWVFGVLLGLQRYVWRRWALREGILQTKDYRLFGRRVGRLTKRTKHDRASLYDLPKDSAFAPCTVMVLTSDEPEVYVGCEARTLLEPDQVRTLIAHELGHSWSQHHVGFELAQWVRRLFFVPVMGWAVCALLASLSARWEPVLVFVFLTALSLIWKADRWVSNLLNRPRELAADLYAVEMTQTPEAFVEGMRRLAEVDLYNVFPSIYDALGFCTHPCLMKRVEYVAKSLEISGRRSHHVAKRRSRIRRR